MQYPTVETSENVVWNMKNASKLKKTTLYENRFTKTTKKLLGKSL